VYLQPLREVPPVKLSELIRAKLDEAETEEDTKLREKFEGSTQSTAFVDAVMDARETKKPGSRRKRFRRVSYGTMELRARAAGYEKFSKVTLSNLVNGELKEFPKPDTIFALAAALRVSAEVVTAAVAREFNIHIHQAERPGGPPLDVHDH
jgi:transcriptional regulator with XRE-family HTH domain